MGLIGRIVGELAGRAKHVAKQTVANAVTKVAGEVKERTDKVRDIVAEGRRDVFEKTKGVKDKAAKAVSVLKVEDRIEKLGAGDSFKLQASVDASGMGIAGRVQGMQTITRNEDGGFTLAVNGQAGLGLMAKVGATGGLAKASAFANGGATVEFKFDTAEEAADAARMFMGPQLGGLSGLIDGGLKEAIDGVLPNPEIYRKNLSAYELSGGISGELFAQLGFSGGKLGMGLQGQLQGRGDVSARIEFNKGGSPELALKQTVQLNGNASVNVLAGASTGGLGKMVIEERFALPRGLNALDLVKDPEGTVRQLAQGAVRNGELSVTLTGNGFLNATLGAMGSKVGGKGSGSGQFETELKLTGKTSDILQSGGLQSALDGDLELAFDRLSPVVTVNAKVLPVLVEEVGGTLEGGIGLASVGGSLTGTITDKQEPIAELSGTLDEVQQGLANELKRSLLQLPLPG